jgi:hypothetical protein
MQSKRHYRFRMNLRLYSDGKPLAGLAETLKFPHKHLHIKGEPMIFTGPLAGKLAKSHYVTFEETKTDDVNDISPWIDQNTGAIAAVPEIVDDLRSKRVTATLWIAMFGREETPLPTVPAEVVQKVRDCGASLFLENYTIMDPEHGNPLKVWPTGEP